MLKTFKFIALLEGISLLVLLFIAMPLKYWLDKPEMVSKVGMAHGVLFILYIVMATVLKNDEKWSWKKYGLICIASIIPFGTFVMEKKLLESKA
ncbi:DUF3817 domain-containing protein [Myroides marinus]|jgi:integral membrane protein|uniref:DUF3817 domain-containing protein n=1 Tax=Myroides marinus TaxID=703342 RepID=UPI000741E683|nr:DUF3817 domain-containing protein [Myroides marinus]KUF43463.1 hypothetical protein AS361_11130 [Myroides marinus]MDM1346109.1 DUF3817 domain-containing protein [Myroides marinus]MDM1353363.1 DUF3817 domain-containing protein [Myroides marinus]MDM1363989.1 DUF3817 domain-containing protein [Myroides marinus]MDM1500998.1 DUF3817 domain-containing protein [Myroides marinus]